MTSRTVEHLLHARFCIRMAIRWAECAVVVEQGRTHSRLASSRVVPFVWRTSSPGGPPYLSCLAAAGTSVRTPHQPTLLRSSDVPPPLPFRVCVTSFHTTQTNYGVRILVSIVTGGRTRLIRKGQDEPRGS